MGSYQATAKYYRQYPDSGHYGQGLDIMDSKGSSQVGMDSSRTLRPGAWQDWQQPTIMGSFQAVDIMGSIQTVDITASIQAVDIMGSG